MKQLRQLMRNEQHKTAAHQTQRQKQTQRHAEYAPPLVHSAQRVGLRHKAAQCQRQTGRRQDHQQIVNVVGHIEVRHTLFIQQVAQRDLIQRADDLGHRNRRRQNCRTADEVLPLFLCHWLPLSIFSTESGAELSLRSRLFQHIFMEYAECAQVLLPLILALDILGGELGVEHTLDPTARCVHHLGGATGAQ